jgi:ubiquitin-activating enzyme E1
VKLYVFCVGPYTFSIGDTSKFSPYIKGGFVEQIKQPCYVKFEPLNTFFGKKISEKKYLLTDYSKLDRPDTYLSFIESILVFREKYKRLPKAWNEEESQQIVEIAKSLRSDNKDIELNEKILKLLAKTSCGDISPMVSCFSCYCHDNFVFVPFFFSFLVSFFIVVNTVVVLIWFDLI